MNVLVKSDLKTGATYRAKRPVKNAWGEYNDRTIVYLSEYEVQYDGPAIKVGQLRPLISIEKFLQWAGHEVKE